MSSRVFGSANASSEELTFSEADIHRSAAAAVEKVVTSLRLRLRHFDGNGECA